ncbi:hypothetical protein CWE13_08355 [Aliidiomarina shirensis]|uniref:diguanylate cyclase n=2 Tax=Aliidiomarina shirensis TaxID=1048642 RepID=A0A432WSV3_9GAMM|nr:hypothetical protein CWE13_08355 [Aliidiomarina shirensis]
MNVQTPFQLVHDPARHQRSLLKSLLIIIFIFSAVIGTINVVTFDSWQIASFNYTSMISAILIGWLYRRTGHLLVASWLLCAAVIFNLFSFILLAKGGAYSLIWITVLPPIAFFLLGKRAGSWLTGATFVSLLTFLFWQMPNLPSTAFSTGAFLNITEVLLGHWLIFRHYEGSREAAFAEMERLSITDKLTGLHNRAKLDSILEMQMAYLQRLDQPFVVMLIDIDYFKRVNDNFGHLHGDQVLQKVASVLSNSVRKTDEVGRWGGEEFLLLCPQTDLASAIQLANSLREQIEREVSTANLTITVSIGVAEINKYMPVTEALGRADDALYKAKENGRNCVMHA